MAKKKNFILHTMISRNQITLKIAKKDLVIFRLALSKNLIPPDRAQSGGKYPQKFNRKISINNSRC